MAAQKKDTSKQTDAVLAPPSRRILVADVGGTSVKLLVTGEVEPRSFRSGRKLTPTSMVERAVELSADWKYDVISIGLPARVGAHGAQSEPGNLGPGWVGFDFESAFGKPVRLINDAAMQALGSYDGGKMLFLGLGTGLGSTLVSNGIIIPLELGNLWWSRKGALGMTLGKKGLAQIGKREWRRILDDVVAKLMAAFGVDYVVIGGGNAKKLREMSPGTRLGHNLTAFRGGFRLWNLEDVGLLWGKSSESVPAAPVEWRIV